VPRSVEASTDRGTIAIVAIVARVADLPPPKPDRSLEDEIHGNP
jgi:hypothetical protein